MIIILFSIINLVCCGNRIPQRSEDRKTVIDSQKKILLIGDRINRIDDSSKMNEIENDSQKKILLIGDRINRIDDSSKMNEIEKEDIREGTNILEKCTNPRCKQHNKKRIKYLGFGEFMLVDKFNSHLHNTCEECKEFLNQTIVFNKCFYKVKWIRSSGKEDICWIKNLETEAVIFEDVKNFSRIKVFSLQLDQKKPEDEQF